MELPLSDSCASMTIRGRHRIEPAGDLSIEAMLPEPAHRLETMVGAALFYLPI